MGDQIRRREFPHTVAALGVYDATQAQRSLNWQKANTVELIEGCNSADQVALREVQEAFYLDTQDFNRKDDCYVVSIKFMRKVATFEIGNEDGKEKERCGHAA